MKHLTLSDRIRIETMLEQGKSFSQIAKELGKYPTTISREIRNLPASSSLSVEIRGVILTVPNAAANGVLCIAKSFFPDNVSF